MGTFYKFPEKIPHGTIRSLSLSLSLNLERSFTQTVSDAPILLVMSMMSNINRVNKTRMTGDSPFTGSCTWMANIIYGALGDSRWLRYNRLPLCIYCHSLAGVLKMCSIVSTEYVHLALLAGADGFASGKVLSLKIMEYHYI